MTDTEWTMLYENRLARLQKLLSLNAPQIIIDSEMKLVRIAHHKGFWKMIWHDIARRLRSHWADLKYRFVKEGEEDNG